MTTTTLPTTPPTLDGHWEPYPTYMDSGVKWLGEVPAHWQVKRLKFVASTPQTKMAEIPTDVPYVGLEHVESRTGRLISEKPVEGVESIVNVFVKGDVLFGKLRPYLAKVLYADFAGVCTTELLVLQPHRATVGGFLFYQLLSDGFIKSANALTYGARMPRVDPTQLMNLRVSLPPLDEQDAIVAFLDRETAENDALIARKERQIGLLQEKRAALIDLTVTKGLDAGVPMKDSGVEWLGEVPEQWEVRRIRVVAQSLQTGPFGSQLHAEDYFLGGTPVINPTHMRDGRIYPDEDSAVDEATSERLSQHRLCEGDIVFARRGELGRCALVSMAENGWLCGTGSLRMRPDRRLAEPLFLRWLLSARGVRDWLSLESVGSTMDNLNTSILGRLPLPLPRLEEQRAIAFHLNRETAKIDALVARIRQSIAGLREYRAALISAAVTGKIDVRGQGQAEGREAVPGGHN